MLSARQRFAASRVRFNPTDPEDLSLDRRCITFGTPRLGGNYVAGPYSYYEIVQTPEYVVLTTEFIHEAWIIPLDGRPHLPKAITCWNGDSRGHWEGQTLVVDTTNFSPKSHFMGSAENLHLVERFRRVDADTITYEITVTDPSTWARPWTGVIHLKRTDERIYEVAVRAQQRRKTRPPWAASSEPSNRRRRVDVASVQVAGVRVSARLLIGAPGMAALQKNWGPKRNPGPRAS